ncbi:MAG: Gfo/Idh/MocA family oxidoreductase [Planctomycetota bacterium]
MPDSDLKPVRIGCIGTGNISGQYLSMQKNFPIVDMVAVADLDRDRAQKAADEHGIAHVLTVDELIAHDDIDVVLNLTIPAAHVEISLRCIEAGKHTYLEKPLGVNREEGAQLVEKANAANLRVGCAPDTFMGSGLQTARKLIDDGVLGEITGFNAFMIGRGHEHWHPSPEFYYQPGGGPMFDMGPYYLTALLNLLGPAKRLSGMTTVAIPERTITSEPKNGQVMHVTTPDHFCGTIEFDSGVVGSIIQSFAMRNAPGIEPFVVYGTKATMKVPDPNSFDNKVYLKHEVGDDEWHEQPMAFVEGYGRSVGLADMAYAIQSGRDHRCSLEQCFTVLDMMQGFLDSSENSSHHAVAPGYTRPKPMPADLPYGELDR